MTAVLYCQTGTSFQEYKLFTIDIYIVGYYDTLSLLVTFLTIVDIINNLIFWLTLPTYVHLNIPP
jgi:hypothetical protein